MEIGLEQNRKKISITKESIRRGIDSAKDVAIIKPKQQELLTTNKSDNKFSKESIHGSKKRLSAIMPKQQELEDMEEIYKQSFTVHGLTRVFKGYKIEKYVWGTLLTVGLLVILYIISGFITKYNSNEIYTSARRIITDRNTFPAITICMERRKFDSFCENNIKYTKYTGRTIRPDKKRPCMKNLTKFQKPLIWDTNGNGKFILGCSNDMISCYDIRSEYAITSSFSNNSCVTINPEGNFSNPENVLDFKINKINDEYFKKLEDKSLEFNVHAAGEYGVFKPAALKLSWRLGYQILLQKTIIKHLPVPYPSKCQEKKPKDIILPGVYTSDLCQKSFKCIEALKACGVTYDICHPYLSKEMLHQYAKEQTENNAYKCLKELRFPKSGCNIECHENLYSVSGTPYSIPKNEIRLQIVYQHPNTYDLIEEGKLYTADSLFSDIGGFVGFVLGASAFSLIEIIAFLLIKLVMMLRK